MADSILDTVTARQLAAQAKWPLAKAEHVLEALVDRGLAIRTVNDSYLISGMGLAMGERMGVTKPCDPVTGYEEKIAAREKSLDGGIHPFIED